MPINAIKAGQQNNADGVEFSLARGGRTGGQVVHDAHGRYYEASRLGNLFVAHAIVTAPVIYSTAAATGGPLIWNGGMKLVNILGVGHAVTTASAVVGALGLTGGTGQTAAPTSTTAIDGRSNLLLGGSPSGATPYRIGTVAVPGAFLIPFASIGTDATTLARPMTWTDLGGILSVPPGAWCSVAASATLTSFVAQIAVVYEEVPV